MPINEVEEVMEREKVEEIALQFTDLVGILHTLWVPVKHFSTIFEEGMHTDGSSLGVVDVSKSDVKLIPDPSSFIVLPHGLFPQRVARVVCDLYEPDSTKQFELDPRFILKKVLKNIQGTLGANVNSYTASEIEFFLFEMREHDKIKLIDEAGYLASPPADRGAELRLEMTKHFSQIGIAIEKHHHEVPHGKSEFNLAYDQALRMADTIYLVKFLTKIIAAKKGVIASFMPKPFHGEYGAGLHTHINLRDDKNKVNLFADPAQSHGLSDMALGFMAGILAHAKGLTGITNPSVNSYKRLVPGWEAPVYISWANYNRSTLIRIPPGKKKAARLEYRPTDGSCNFYLSYAALLATGLDGIKKKLIPPPAVEEDIYKMSPNERTERGIETLPGNFGEALYHLRKDRDLEESLGSDFYQKYLEVKTREWHDFNVYVHEWERKRYLDV
ncbi:MAG: type I glutamate--ammonia ligase [Candidatus Heimdallarchaeota archaeon]